MERGAVVFGCLASAITFLQKSDNVNRIRRDRTLRGLMAALLFSIAAGAGYHLLTWYPDIYNHPMMKRFIVQCDLLCMPLICLIMTSLARRKEITLWQSLRHFAPFVLLLIIGFFWKGKAFIYVYSGFAAIYLAVMVNLILIALTRYEQQLEDQYSDIYGRDLMWIYTVACVIAVSCVLWFATLFVKSPWIDVAYNLLNCFIWTYVSANVHRVLNLKETSSEDLYKPIARPTIQEEKQEEAEERQAEANMAVEAEAKQETPAELFANRLRKVCEEQKLFTSEDLTREELAREMMVNHTYLTRMLKQTQGKSFYEYINGLRMGYAAELLADRDFPLDGIPLEVGYKHKSTYYRVFQDFYGCTPLEYRNRLMAAKTASIETK